MAISENEFDTPVLDFRLQASSDSTLSTLGDATLLKSEQNEGWAELCSSGIIVTPITFSQT